MLKESKIDSRKDKWKKFFNDEGGIGGRVFACIIKKNPLWKGSAEVAAEKIAGIYNSASDYAHATSHEINEDKSKSIAIDGSLAPQAINAMVCIAETCGLQLELTH
jgi:hypothetical protein